MLAKGAERGEEKKEDREWTEKQRTVISTVVSIHGNWDINDKDDNGVTFFCTNVNSLAYWSKHCNKAERLKYLFDEYGVDTAGLQEVCVNWAKLPPSKTMAKILRNNAEYIRSVASHNKMGGKRQGVSKVQRGGTVRVLREELAPWVEDSDVDPSGLGR